ncbi:fimbrial protein YehD [Escherichia sp. E2593]|uniref:fimbrial protein YehD n=1 Tax=unclassified Escherichia TaxID=2608889 RepID=UPI001028BA16|nr:MULTISPECIES: fimbrial protein YehD [unclassified Escherichia]RZN37641.1 fimbrial protein YehD [Escherichia sp. E10V5]TGC09084.1 fimbrial chaperone protein [Escherichia sp. E2593]TLI77300.1 fimbrial protein YehD [Escherichia sp. E2593]
MKRSIIAVAVLSSLFMSAGAFAEGNQQGELIITGKVAGTTCQFTEATTATITMNEIGADQLNGQEAGYIHEGYSNTTILPLKVKCTGEKPPKITFSRDQFDVGNSGITRNTAEENGAGFAVYYEGADGQSQQIKGDDYIHLVKNDANEYELNFRAKYAAVGTEVKAGAVNSALTMTVVTD